MPFFRKKPKTPYSAESDISQSSADKAAERMVRVFRAAGLDSHFESSRKSASRYVYVEDPDKPGMICIRISNHYLPDKYGDLEKGVDYQVFTSDMEALAETVRAVLRLMGRAEPAELQRMLARSRAQTGIKRKVRSESQVLAELVREKIESIARCSSSASIEILDLGESRGKIKVLRCDSEGLAHFDDRKEEWISTVMRRFRAKRLMESVAVPSQGGDSPSGVAGRLLSAWQQKLQELERNS